jgi:hypothetical protein
LRKLILAASLLAIAAPALAQPRYERRYDPRDEEIQRHIPQAHEIERMGETLARVTDALMDIDIAPLADAIDPARRHDRRRGPETLGDLASRDDPYARERIRDEVRMTTRGLSVAAEEIAVVTPVISRSIAESARRIEEAVRDSRYRYRERNRYEDR